MLEETFVTKGVKVQSLELSKQDIFTDRHNVRDFLLDNVEKHDVLFIGSPIYNGHLQYHVKDLIRALPVPDGLWGKYSVPFVTWGGVQTGVALYEAVSLLMKSGRKSIAGMEINGEHQMTRDHARVINQGLPGDEAMPLINELAGMVMNAMQQKPDDLVDIAEQVRPGITERINARITANERFFQRVVFPDPIFDSEICTGCGSCVRACPVQRLTLADGKSVAKAGSAPACIHCYECVRWCEQRAMTCIKLSKFEGFFEKKRQLTPLNTIYPSKTGNNPDKTNT